MKTNTPQAQLDIIRGHRAAFAQALDASLAKKKQAEIEIDRNSGGVAALDMLIAKLTAAPDAPDTPAPVTKSPAPVSPAPASVAKKASTA